MPSPLRIGFAEIDITPCPGDTMAGSLLPRPAKGTDDPLFVRAIAVEQGDTCFIHASFDLCVLPPFWGDASCRRIAAQTGVPEDHILWTATHTHSGPDCGAMSDPDCADPTWVGTANAAWLARLEEAFLTCTASAWDARQPATVRRARAYCNHVAHNRRLCHKDGRQVNTWLLNHPDDADTQCTGSAAPIDPEIGMLAISYEEGALAGLVWTYALHTNAHFGSHFSADYPAATQEELRKAFGHKLFCMYLPGTCGDLNPVMSAAETGKALAAAMLPALKAIGERKPERAVAGFMKTTAQVPMHDFGASIEDRLVASRWADHCKPFFRNTCATIRRTGATERPVELAAWHIGDVSFATYPAEVFVEWGLELKRRGKFPWTFPVELTNGWVGYLPTPEAWEAGGYESIPSATSRIAPHGTAAMNATLLGMLGRLHDASSGKTA